MSLPSRRLSLSVLAVALAGVVLPVAAQQGPRGRQDGPQTDPPPAHGDAVSDAVRRFERANRGQVLSAERMQYDGRDVTRIKAVDGDGRVRIYMDDPQPATDSPRPQRRDDTPPRRPRGDR